MVRLRVRIGNVEVEIEAESEKLAEVVETIPRVIEKLKVNVESRSLPIQQKKENQLPQISIEKSDSLSDIIEKLFSSEWGLSERKLSEVREVLRTYGLNYPKQSVAVSLLRLAKAGKIRRFKTDSGDYAYTSSTPTVIGVKLDSKEEDLSDE